MSPDWGDSGKGKSGGGKGNSGGVPPGKASGKDALRQKGKAMQEEWFWRRAEGPQTAEQERRQKKHADREASGALYRPQPQQDTSHQLKCPWPYDLKSYPMGWLNNYKNIAMDMGLKLRWSGHRNSVWKSNPEKAAALWEITITGKPGDPEAQPMAMHLLADLLKDPETARLRVTADQPFNAFDWGHIISTWEGDEEQDRIFYYLTSHSRPHLFTIFIY